MGTFTCALFFAWLLQNNLAVAVVPLLASSNICKFNPTQTTIALEKPYCFYINPNPVNVYLLVVRNDALNATFSNGSFTTTAGGYSAPYVAAIFSNPNCINTPTASQIYNITQVQATLDKYVVRVGNDSSCFNVYPCNKPLQSNTAYRFSYAFYNSSSTNLVFQSDWSPPIYTKQGKDSGNIDTWPGRRSGGMIVITSILSVLTFFVLAGLVAAVISNLMTPSANLEPRRHETQTSHTVAQKAEGGVEYATALSASERYATNPQA
ncbi:uroplakin-3a [Mantella aurantiaca]